MRRLRWVPWVALFVGLFARPAFAAGPPTPSGTSVSQALSQDPTLSILGLLAVLALLPGIILLMTSFTRIVVVLSLVRAALGLNQVPPNQVVVGLAIFLTLFVMAPTLSKVETTALNPYLQGQVTLAQASHRAEKPLKTFLAEGTRQSDLALMLRESGQNTPPKSIQSIPLSTLVPAYTISQLTLAFEMGVLLFIPFVIIDFIVASVLMALGMMMVPPTLISLPVKLLLFVLMNGWALVVQSMLSVR